MNRIMKIISTIFFSTLALNSCVAWPSTVILALAASDAKEEGGAPLWMLGLLGGNNSGGAVPFIATDGAGTFEEDTTYTVDLSLLVSGNREVPVYSIVTAPTNGTLNPPDCATGICSYTPDANFNGSDVITFKASETLAERETGAASFDLTIVAVDDLPSIVTNADPDPVSEDTVSRVSVNTSDADGEELTYTITTDGSNGSCSFDAATGEIVYTPDPDWSGTDTCTIVASDGTSNSSPATITFTVLAVDDSISGVTYNSTSGTGVADEGNTIYFTVSGVDGTGGTLVYSATGLPAGFTIDSSTGAISGSPAASDVGSYTITVTVTAEDGSTALETLSLTINDNPPDSISYDSGTYGNSATAESNSFSVSSSIGTLTPTATDYSGTLTWSISPDINSETGLTFNTSTGVISGTPTSACASTNPCQFTVTASNSGGSASLTFYLDVDDEPPTSLTYDTYTASTTVGASGTTLASVVVSDGSGNTYSLTPSSGSLPAGVQINSSTGAIQTSGATTGGTYQFKVRASNTSDTVVDSLLFTITVNNTVPTSISYAGDANNDQEIDSATGGSPAPVGGFFTTGAASTDSTGGESYSTTGLTGSGGAALPAFADTLAEIGLSINSSTGSISGTPTVSGTFEVTVQADNTASGGGTTTETFTFTIADPTISISDVTVAEKTDTSDATASFTATISNASINDIVISWHTGEAGDSATEGSDYTSGDGGSDTITAGNTTVSLDVAVKDDAANGEGDETFSVVMDSATNTLAISDDTGIGTIQDGDVPNVSFALASASYSEGAGTITVTVNADTPAPVGGLTIPLTYSSAALTYGAVYGASNDYVDADATLTVAIAGGATSGTFDITINDDSIDEGNGTDLDYDQFKITLTDGAAFNLGATSVHTATIIDNDAAPTAVINDPAAVTEANSATVDYTVSLTGNVTEREIQVDYATAGSTAVEGTDYTAASGTLTFVAGDTSEGFSVSIINDTKYETTEIFTATISAAAGFAEEVTIPSDGTEVGNGQIANDDAIPSLSIADHAATEADTDTTMTFTVTLSHPTGVAISVNYYTADISTGVDYAIADTDYTAISSGAPGTLNIAADDADNQGTFTITVKGDNIKEKAETFHVILTGYNLGGSISDGTAIGTINNDDTPTVSFSSYSPKTDSGLESSAASIVVSMDTTSTTDTIVNYTFTDGDALAGTDYTASTTQITISAGSSTGNISVPVTSDTIDENDEDFTVTLVSGSGYLVNGSDKTLTYTITDDDSAPSITINDPSVTETNTSGSDTTLSFTVSLDHASENSITVDYTTTDSTAISTTTDATYGDYAATTGTLTFAAGETSKSVVVTIKKDDRDETNETFFVNLSNVNVNATIGDSQGVGTITDNDAAPTISIADSSVTESDATDGSTKMTFTVSLSAPSGKDVVVEWYTTAGSATGSGTDYWDVDTRSGGDNGVKELTIAADDADGQATITVDIYGDNTDEGANETFTVTLDSASNTSSISDATATGTIIEDDARPVYEFNAATYSVAENGGTVTVILTSTDTGSFSMNVDYTFLDGTATGSGTDYTTSTTTTNVSFSGGTGSFTVAIDDDGIDEANETFTITLTDNGGASAGTYDVGSQASTVVTITDNEVPILSITSIDASVAESGTSYTVNFETDIAPYQGLTVNYTFGGTATGGDGTSTNHDYINTTSSVSMTGNGVNTSGSVTITVIDDDRHESSETVSLTLAAGTGYTLTGSSDTSHTETITDDDTVGISLIQNYGTIYEQGDPGISTFTVVLDTEPTGDVVVDITINGSTQVSLSGTGHTFTAANWDTPKEFYVSALAEQIDDGNQSVTVTTSINTGSTTDADYDAYAATFNAAHDTEDTVLVTDNDTAGYTFSTTSLSDTEGAATSFQVHLTSEPLGTVTLTLTGNADVHVHKDGGSASISETLTFTSANWNVYQSVTVTAVDDLIVESSPEVVSIITSTGSSNGGDATNYTGGDGVVTDISVSVTDNDTADITVSKSSLTVLETGATENTFTVSLATQPASGEQVVVTVSLDTGADATADVFIGASTSPASSSSFDLTFTNGDWAAKTVYVKAIDDLISEGVDSDTVNLTRSASTTATGYESFAAFTGNGTGSPFAVVAGVTDNDAASVASVTVEDDSNPGVGDLAVSATEGGASGTIRITVGDIAASSNVCIDLDDGSSTQFTLGASSVTFSDGEDNTSKTVSVTAVDDASVDGNITETVTVSVNTGSCASRDTNYDAIDPDDISVTSIDNDVAPSILSATTVDADGDGRIDGYDLIFSIPVDDSTFTDAKWSIAGYSISGYDTGVTADDTLLTITFGEGAGFDSGAKPDLTTISTGAIQSLNGINLAIVSTADLTEADGSKPVVTNAYADESSSTLTVLYSEAVYGAIGALSCGGGGNLTVASATYLDGNVSGALSILSMGSDSCGSDAGLGVEFTMNTSFVAGDTVDSVSGSAGLYDAANNTGAGTALYFINVTNGPRINSIYIYDSNSNGKIDQLKLKFNMNMNDGSASGNAGQFVWGTTSASSVDSVTGGSGTVSYPNDDPESADDTIITLFTNDTTEAGTGVKGLTFTQSADTWEDLSSGIDLVSSSDLSSLIVDKAPPVILSAVAYDNGTAAAGVDSDDTLVIAFSESTNKPVICTTSVSTGCTSPGTVFNLTGGSSWGDITSAIWNAGGNQLTLTFAGSGSTLDVGNTITINGTITDNAPLPNTSTALVAISPISGSFYTDTVPPYFLTVANVTTTTVTVVFSEPMLADSTASAMNTIANYKLDENDGTACATTSDTNIGIDSIDVISANSVQLNLTSGQVLCDIQYKLALASGRDLLDDPAGNSMGSPNYLTFIGNEQIKVLSAEPTDEYHVRIWFSKIPFPGNNVSGSAGCSSAGECSKRYKILPDELGDISSAVVGSGTLANSVILTHTIAQAGKAYTVLVANNLDGDGFDNNTSNTSTQDPGDNWDHWGALWDQSNTLGNGDTDHIMKPYPGDRAGFTGSGTVYNSFDDGAYYSDPFADGTTFSWAFTYGGKVYLGTNDTNNAAFRFEPGGDNSVTATFDFPDYPATDNFGYIDSNGTPYLSGDDTTYSTGPVGERGVGGFTSVDFTVGGTDYEALFVGPIKTGVGQAYFTQDLDSVLDWKGFTIWKTTGANAEAIHTIYGVDNKLFVCLSTDHGNFAPQCGVHTITQSSGVLSIGSGSDVNAYNTGTIGAKASNPAAGDIIGIDSMLKYNGYLYFANNGGIYYTTNMSDWKTGGVASLSGSTSPAWSGTTLVLNSLGKIRSGEKGIPALVEFDGKLYMARNVADTGVNNTTPLRGELWRCDPTTTGGAATCEPNDWTRIVSGAETSGATPLPTRNAISMLQVNGGVLYLGFDDEDYAPWGCQDDDNGNGILETSDKADCTTSTPTGIRIYRVDGAPSTTSSNDITTGGWVKQASDGLVSDPVHLYIFSATSIYNAVDASDYIYITSADEQEAIRVFRQID